jgi:hypothetical protein
VKIDSDDPRLGSLVIGLTVMRLTTFIECLKQTVWH